MEITKEKQLADVGRLIAEAEAVADDWLTDDSGVQPYNKNCVLGVVNMLYSMEARLEGESKEPAMRKNKPHKGYLREYMRITGTTLWKETRYRFDFDGGVYTMDGKPLRIRPSEALYLYERLVLHKPPKETTCRYSIQRLRERHGAGFLEEIFGHGHAGGAEGKARREAFERALQGYMEEDGRTAYEEWKYRFDFLNGSYTWDGEDLRVTPKESVFLYERAVLRLRGRRGVRRYAAGGTLRDMRKRFGSAFLRELDRRVGI